MSTTTATAAEARAHFARASAVSETEEPVTILRNSKPWVTISPISETSPVKAINWSEVDRVRMDPKTRITTLPADWDDAEDDGVYDDLV